MGRPGRVQFDGVYVVPLPRADLVVTIAGIKAAPAIWMASSVGFSAPGDGAMMMGDLVLTEDEVAPVAARLLENGIRVAALHNHLTHESPRLLFLHVECLGNAVKLAQGMKAAIAALKIGPPAPGTEAGETAGFDIATIEQLIGHKGRMGGGALNISVARRESISAMGMKLPASMGTSTILHLQPLGNGRAAVSGDLVLAAPEVDPVSRVLAANAIELTSIHSHMLDEEPRLFFLHFWASGDTLKLAHALGTALEKTNSVK